VNVESSSPSSPPLEANGAASQLALPLSRLACSKGDVVNLEHPKVEHLAQTARHVDQAPVACGAIGESKRFFERWRTLPDRSIATSIAGAERSVAAFATV